MRRHRTVLLCSAIVVLAACGAYSSQWQTGTFAFPPLDEAKQEPALVAFRDRLLKALSARSVEAVVSAVAPDYRQEFRSSLTWGMPESRDWVNLIAVFRLGGSFTTTRGKVKGRREFCAPYTYSAYPMPPPESLLSYPDGEVNPWVIVGQRTAARARPEPNARILAYLGHQLVQVDGGAWGTPAQWYSVMVNGEVAWVAADQMRSPEDYHACVAIVNGQWFLTEFERGSVPQ